MTAIWSETPSGWGVLQPTGFPDEKTLQELVARTPELLPLSGAPRLVVLGREVSLGSGRVDVLAIEPTGRPVVIEVKLRNNTESRRAVVAQVLAYAAALYGSTADEFESDVLATQLAGRGLHDVVREAVQTEVPDAAAFHTTLDAALADGAMRVVLVLDRAPQDLIRLVGYLEAVTHGLVIDLITVASYELDGRRFVVPQRVEPERIVREASEPGGTPAPATRSGELVDGHEPFLERIFTAPVQHRPVLDLFAGWAVRLSDARLADIRTFFGKNGDVVFLPRLRPDQGGLVSLYVRADGRPALQWWRSVFEKHAPGSIDAVGAAGGAEIGRGTLAPVVDQALLDAVFAAYVEASG